MLIKKFDIILPFIFLLSNQKMSLYWKVKQKLTKELEVWTNVLKNKPEKISSIKNKIISYGYSNKIPIMMIKNHEDVYNILDNNIDDIENYDYDAYYYCNQLIKKVNSIIISAIFTNELSEYDNYKDAGIILTKSISKLDKKIEKVIINTILLNNYYDEINSVLKEIETDKKDLEKYGYLRTKIINNIKKMLMNIYGTRYMRILKSRELFQYLAQEDCIRFIQNNYNFKINIQKKLSQFYYGENLQETKVWCRNIFQEDIEQPYYLSLYVK